MMLIDNPSSEEIKKEFQLENIFSPGSKKEEGKEEKKELKKLEIPKAETQIKKLELQLLNEEKKLNRNTSNQYMNTHNQKKLLKNFSAELFLEHDARKRVNKAEEQKIVSSMYERMTAYKKKCEEKTEALKKKLAEKEMKEANFKPRLNHKCSVDTTEIKKENFLTRSTKFLKKNKTKREQILKEKQLKEKKIINPKLNKKGKLSDINKKLSSLFEWEQNTKKKIENKKKERNAKELSTCTFKPELNDRSKKLARSSSAYATYNTQGLKKYNSIYGSNKKLLSRSMCQEEEKEKIEMTKGSLTQANINCRTISATKRKPIIVNKTKKGLKSQKQNKHLKPLLIEEQTASLSIVTTGKSKLD